MSFFSIVYLLWPGYFLLTIWAIFRGCEAQLLPGVSPLSVSIPLTSLAHLFLFFFFNNLFWCYPLPLLSSCLFPFLALAFPSCIAHFHLPLSHSVPIFCSPLCPTFLSPQPTDAHFSHLIFGWFVLLSLLDNIVDLPIKNDLQCHFVSWKFETKHKAAFLGNIF